MARRTTTVKTAPDFVPEDVVDTETNPFAAVDAEWAEEWETVVDESPTMVILDKDGDVFIGEYLRAREVVVQNPKPGKDPSFTIHEFRGPDGELYGFNDSYKIRHAVDDGAFAVGDWVRIERRGSIDTGQGNPMSDYRISVRRRK